MTCKAEPRKAYIDISPGQVHAHFVEGRRPLSEDGVLFLHQTASSGRMFYGVMRELGDERSMVALDTPGFGGSFDPPGMPTMGEYAGWIAAAVEKLQLARVDIVAHHTGVSIAAEMAGRYDWIASIAMIGPVPMTPEERESFRGRFSAPMSPDPEGQYLIDTWRYLQSVGAGSELELLHRELLDHARAYHGRFQAYSALWDQDFGALFRAIRQPLAIMCSRADVLWPFFDRAREMRPDACAYELKGDNFEPDQDAKGLANALRAFWGTGA